jgi:hypothetical protein
MTTVIGFQQDDHHEWASAHGPTTLHYGSDEVIQDVFMMPVGRDLGLALLRIRTWLEDRPDVPAKLLRRTVTYGPWEEVPTDDPEAST